MSPLIEASRPLLRASNASATRSFSIAIPARKAGEFLWSPKPNGFLADVEPTPQRETARQNRSMRTQEADQLKVLKQKMAEQRGHLEEMDRHM
ncbi:hypothetical protein P170DRAFT_504743 [Aspergillus steynii IBT 23096]|uniref:ATPase inhibitor, mitochondrial n=1 Tax=Aspergillus steynii IBT 23096 TaxID=1392250 RepID=A0A2I2GLT4_9EURO|nr:uncharacterized protein P170DRAFT_504743 [Aspergillus steynii IBT 23096]PLB53832.1 hypothetical protein P170DRAFT_504743 [Aspergillus steynii IBT 23096]